ncbi:MAG: hypothetical protein FJW36_20140 [Acidobacteria bacterium]|nr:hypothetical protein [Acidobacteriota bacterium]
MLSLLLDWNEVVPTARGARTVETQGDWWIEKMVHGLVCIADDVPAARAAVYDLIDQMRGDARGVS